MRTPWLASSISRRENTYHVEVTGSPASREIRSELRLRKRSPLANYDKGRYTCVLPRLGGIAMIRVGSATELG
jgi:hypothetical protein